MSQRIAQFTCPEHGVIWSAAVFCQHDTEAEIRAVADAHQKPYGADCQQRLTVDLLDPETMEVDLHSSYTLIPPEAPPLASEGGPE